MDNSSPTVIHQVCYFILHFVYFLSETLKSIYENLISKLLEFYHVLTPANKSTIFPKFEKIPSHLTVLLGDENPSYNDLANLILWCLAAQITFVSFYDHKGALNKDQEKLQEKVREKKTHQDHVIWHDNRDSVHKNGYIGRKIHVKVLTEEDGRVGVVNVTKKLALNRDTNYTIDSFDNELRKQYEFPDPELGLCCGKTFCLFGYPPWPIRLTEFFSLKSHHNLKFNTFVMLLHRYSKCEQRYGK